MKVNARSLTFCLLVVFSACIHAPTQVEREIRAAYKQLERAYTRQDFDGIMATRDRDLVVVVPEGVNRIETYEETAGLMRKWFSMNKPPIELRYIIESITVHSPDEAVVRVLQRGSRYQERDGHMAHVKHEVRQRETWIRTSSGWKVRKIDEIDLASRKVWEDGRSIPLSEQ